MTSTLMAGATALAALSYLAAREGMVRSPERARSDNRQMTTQQVKSRKESLPERIAFASFSLATVAFGGHVIAPVVDTIWFGFLGCAAALLVAALVATTWELVRRR